MTLKPNVPRQTCRLIRFATLKSWPFSHTLFLLVFPANSNLTMEGPTAGYYSPLTVVSLCTVSRSDVLTLARLLDKFIKLNRLYTTTNNS